MNAVSISRTKPDSSPYGAFFEHPWTNGMVEAMNQKIKANTVKRFDYDRVEQLKEHWVELTRSIGWN